MKTKGAINIGIILAFIVVLGAIGFFVWQNQNDDVPTVVTVPGWQTYINEQYGFSIQYPPDWEVAEGYYPALPTTFHVSFFSPNTIKRMKYWRDKADRGFESEAPAPGLEVKVTSVDDYFVRGPALGDGLNQKNLEDYVKGWAIEGTFEEILFAGLPAYHAATQGLDMNNEFFFGTKSYVWVITMPINSVEVDTTVPETEARILSSFKFTD